MYAKGQTDTLRYFLDYYGKRCPSYLGYYYRIQVKEGDLWYVEDYYAREGVLQMNGHFSDDSATKPEGVVYYYHKNSKLDGVERYENGLLEGLSMHYDSTGRLLDSTNYKNNIPVGPLYSWNEAGRLISFRIYDNEGRGTAEAWHYYDNGNLCCHGKISAGDVTDSTWTFYYIGGGISCKEIYNRGKLKKRLCYNADDSTKKVTCKDEHIPVRPAIRQLWQQYVSEEDVITNCKDAMKGRKGRFIADVCIDIDGKATVSVIQPYYPCFDDFFKRAVEGIKFNAPIVHNRPQKHCELIKLDF